MKICSCTEVQSWLARGEPLPSSDMAGALKQHLDDCPHCSTLYKTVRETTVAFRTATEDTAKWAPSFQTVRNAAIEKTASPQMGTWGKWAVAAMVVVMALGVWLYPRGRGDVENGMAVPQELRVEDVRGLASLRGGEDTGASLVNNARLVAGTAVMTGAASQLSAKQSGIASWSLAEDSVLSILAWSNEEVALELQSGEIRVQVEKRALGEQFAVRTEYCTVTVVGTAFVVTHRPGVHTMVSVTSGLVRIDATTGETKLLAAGEATVIPGGRITAAKTILEQPLPDETPEPANLSDELANTPPAIQETRTRHQDDELVKRERVPIERAPIRNARIDRGRPVPAPFDNLPENTTPSRDVQTEASLLAQARVLLSNGNDEQAVTLLKSAIDNGQRTPRLVGLLADAYRISGNADAAKTAYRRALLDSGPSSAPQLLADMAALCEQSGDHEEAARTWETLLKTAPNHHRAPDALAFLATNAEKEGDTEKANHLWFQLCERFSMSSQCTKGFVIAGKSLLQRRDWDAAEQHFVTRTQSPNKGVAEAAMVGLIRTKLGRGQLGEARRWLEKLEHDIPNPSRKDEIEAFRKSLTE